jgi:hypothetical protein
MKTYYRTGIDDGQSILDRFQLYLIWLKRRDQTVEEHKFLGEPYDEKSHETWVDATYVYAELLMGIVV